MGEATERMPSVAAHRGLAEATVRLGGRGREPARPPGRGDRVCRELQTESPLQSEESVWEMRLKRVPGITDPFKGMNLS